MQLAPAPPPPPAPSAEPTIPPEIRWAPVPAPFYRKLISLIVLIGPPLTAVFVTVKAIGEPVPWLNLLLLTAFYFVIAHGVTIGFHRLFTHRSFEARRPLKVILAVLGSMSFQGSIIGWVADHRRHHRYSDRPGDPHSPVQRGGETLSGWRGFLHAHASWVFSNAVHAAATSTRPTCSPIPTSCSSTGCSCRCCIATLALPFGLGYALTGTLAGALGALVFAGSCGSASATTSRGRSTPCATRSGSARSARATAAPTSRRSRSSPAVSRGTTRTTRSRRWRVTASTAVSSTRRPG